MRPRSGQARRQKLKCGGFLGLLRRVALGLKFLECTQPSRFVTQRDARRIRAAFLSRSKVYQTRPCVGFPDPMGTWCIWPRPQAESVVT